MKKNIFISIVLTVTLICMLIPPAVLSAAESNVVYTGKTTSVSSSYGDGSRENPYNRFEDAVKNVADGGVIYIKSGTEGFLNTQDELGLIPFIIDKNVTIMPEGGHGTANLTVRAAGIILGGDVTFKNITLGFANKYHDAIFANGHTLTLINVTQPGGTRDIDLFAGALCDLSTFEPVLAPGGRGVINIQVNEDFSDPNYNCVFGNIYGGSNNGNFTGNAQININSGGRLNKLSIGNIYACGALESKIGNMFDLTEPDPPTPLPDHFKTLGDVSVKLGKFSVDEINGETGSSAKTSLDISTEYPIETIALNKIDSITVSDGKFKPAAITGQNSSFSSLTVKGGAELDLSCGSSWTAGSFHGGGALTLKRDGLLNITETLDGVTALQTEGAFGGRSGIAEDNHTYITAANGDANSFTFSPCSSQPGYALEYSSDGMLSWKTVNNGTELPIVNSLSVYNQSAVTDSIYINGHFGENKEDFNDPIFFMPHTLIYNFNIEYESPENEGAVIPFELSAANITDERIEYKVAYDGSSYFIRDIGMELYAAYDAHSNSYKLSVSRDLCVSETIPAGKYEITVSYPTVSGNDSMVFYLTVLESNMSPHQHDSIVNVNLKDNSDRIICGEEYTVTANISEHTNTLPSYTVTGSGIDKNTVDFYMNGVKLNSDPVPVVNGSAQTVFTASRENGVSFRGCNVITAVYGGSDELAGNSGLLDDIYAEKLNITDISPTETENYYYNGTNHVYNGDFEITAGGKTLSPEDINEIKDNLVLSYKRAEEPEAQNDYSVSSETKEPGIYNVTIELPEGAFYNAFSASHQAFVIEKADPAVEINGTITDDNKLRLEVLVTGPGGISGNADIYIDGAKVTEEPLELFYELAVYTAESLSAGAHTVYAEYTDNSGLYNNSRSKAIEITLPAASGAPTVKPSESPSETPATEPTVSPSAKPSEMPTAKPTSKPSAKPSDVPTVKPSESPLEVPSAKPTANPSESPCPSPSSEPSMIQDISVSGKTALFTINNISDTDYPDLALIAALYSDGSLKEAQLVAHTEFVKGSVQRLSAEFKNDAENGTVRLFIWNSLSGMKPLCMAEIK